MQVENPSIAPLKPKDYASDAEVRWCPGCGDYSILKQVQEVLAEIGTPREELVFISGIGCSSRFPYYMNTYGVHSLHGRALPMAIGLKTTRPELSVWVITGDGDCFSIGGNHFIHGVRRNPNLNILLFNNEIYGLTKGQISPTSEFSKITKSTPLGGLDQPLNPIGIALAADCTFIARSLDRDPKHLRVILKRADEHKGASFVEMYQNCNIFNDGAFFEFSEKTTKSDRAVFIEHGKPMIFGKENDKALRLNGTTPEVVKLSEVSADDLWIHDEKNYEKAVILSRLHLIPVGENEELFPRPFGVFFWKEKPAYEELVALQIEGAKVTKPNATLDQLIAGRQSWVVE